MRAANESYVLVDSSKYGHRCLTSFARLRDVDLTITDSNLSRSKAKILEAAGATSSPTPPRWKLADDSKSGTSESQYIPKELEAASLSSSEEALTDGSWF